MYDGYLELAGAEVINSVRAATYAASAGLDLACADCPDLPESVGDDPYYSLVDDPAPWWDPKRPESGNFYGVLGLGVTGAGSPPWDRTVTQLISDGGVVSPKRLNHREMAFTVALIAREECSLAFGLEYLAWALEGSACGACFGDEVCMFSCCPGILPPPLTPDGPCGSTVLASGRAVAPGDMGYEELRHLYDATILDGPTLTDVQDMDGFLVATVTFTIASGNPYIFRSPLATLTDWEQLSAGTRVNGFDPDSIVNDCPPATSCTTDTLCPDPATPPLPPVIVDPCYPTGRADWLRTDLALSPIDAPQMLEQVPVIEIETGSGDLRRIVVRFWTNPQGVPCDQLYADPCQACTDITIGYLPPRSRLTIDGRTRRSSVECPDPVTRLSAFDSPNLWGQLGSMFQWPVFPCPTGLCVQVFTRVGDPAPDARVRVQIVPRSKVG